MGELTLNEDHIFLAREFAESVHKDQKWGELPYTAHLDATCSVYVTVADDIEGQCACYLHDTIEDSKEPDKIRHTILHRFGPRVLEITEFCTSVPAKSRKERVRLTNLRTEKSSDFRAMLVKLCDRISNVGRAAHPPKTSFYEMYRKEQVAFKKAIYRSVHPNTLLQRRLDSLFGDFSEY